MDKLFKSNWFVKIISFVIALMLYTMVVAGGQSSSSLFGPPSNQATNSDEPQSSAQVKLNVHYNDSKYLISDLPKTVTVLLQGPTGLLTQVRLTNNYEVFVDLTGKGPGTYSVPVEVKGFPDGLAVNTYPKKVNVTVSEKETKTFPVHVDVINERQVPEGFDIGESVSDPARVQVTAAKDIVDNIAFVEALVNVAETKETIDTTVPIHVFDKQGNELNVNVTPSTVKVKVPVTEHSKMVPIQTVKEGKLPDGYSVQSLDLKTDQVTLFGPEKYLKDIDSLKVPVDLDKIKEDTDLELEIPVPFGVNKVNPEKVTVAVKITKQTTKTLEAVPITVKGKSSGEEVTFTDPEDQQVSVTLTGPKKTLENIGKADIQAFVDISQLTAGEHVVPVELSNPKDKVTADSNVSEAVIQITEGASGQ